MTDFVLTEDAGALVHNWSEAAGWRVAAGKLGQEIALTIYLDQVELATLMCSPDRLNFLVAGFLRSEGIINKLEDLALMRVCDEEQVVDVRLMRPRQLTSKRILTAGCGGGVTFDDGADLKPVESELSVGPDQVLDCMRQLQRLYGGRSEQSGVHVSGLANGRELVAIARDVGRHNTLDKIWGQCLFQGIETAGRVLLTTGRLSSEMVLKAARMGVPIAASLNSPTTKAVELGERLGITLVGYVRGSRLSVYSHPRRLQRPA